MIVFKDINKVFYIQEIKDFKEMALKSITRHERYYLKTRKKLLKKLKKEQILNISNDYELEMISLDYLYKLSCNQLNYYKILSSYYQCLFSIWENASKKYNQKIKYIDLRWDDSHYLRLEGAKETPKVAPKEINKEENVTKEEKPQTAQAAKIDEKTIEKAEEINQENNTQEETN